MTSLLRALYRAWDWVLGACRECGQRKQVHTPGCSRVLKRRPERNSTNDG